MNIVYLVHENSWNENSGTPILTQNYANLAISKNCQVCIVTPSFNKKKYISEKKNIKYLFVDRYSKWSNKAFEQNNRNSIQKINLPFKPDLIHIIDWVNVSPNIISFFKSLKVPIIRHVNSFEDLCYFLHPIYKNENYSLCKSPLSSEMCASCIVKNNFNKNKFLKKIRSILINERKKEFNYYNENILNRHKLIKYHMDNVYDHLIFGSQPFAEYFLSHVKFKKKYSIIKHGIEKDKILNKNTNLNNKLNIIYTGGRSIRKGWNIVEKAFENILKNYADKINIRIYGDKKKLSKSKLYKYKSIEFFDFFEHKEIKEVISWANIAVLPSFFEPYGIIFREFLNLGVIPIVNNNSLGPTDIVKHNENGIIIKDPFVKNLTEEIVKLILNPDILEKLKFNALNTHIPTLEDEFNEIYDVYKTYYKN